MIYIIFRCLEHKNKNRSYYLSLSSKRSLNVSTSFSISIICRRTYTAFVLCRDLAIRESSINRSKI